MRECWHADQSARLSALRLKKSVQELIPEQVPGLVANPGPANPIQNASFNRTNIHSASGTVSNSYT